MKPFISLKAIARFCKLDMLVKKNSLKSYKISNSSPGAIILEKTLTKIIYKKWGRFAGEAYLQRAGFLHESLL